jgi:hypothetical protein
MMYLAEFLILENNESCNAYVQVLEQHADIHSTRVEKKRVTIDIGEACIDTNTQSCIDTASHTSIDITQSSMDVTQSSTDIPSQSSGDAALKAPVFTCEQTNPPGSPFSRSASVKV